MGEHAESNAEVLESALAARRQELGRIAAEEERARRAQALDLIEQYTVLLREPLPASPRRNSVRYSFKLVFPDGRWSVNEKQLSATPRAGDVVEFTGQGNWRIESSERVGVRPAGKPPREFFVCAPAA